MNVFASFLSFEWLKVTKRWMPAIIIILLLGLIAIGFWGQGTRSRDQANLTLPHGWLAALIYTSFFAPFFWPVLGGSWAGNEYGWGTIRMALTRRPYRIQYVLAALVVLLGVLAIALVLALIMGSAAGFLVGTLTNHGGFISSDFGSSFGGALAKSFLGAWYVAAFYLVLAYTAATIFRSAAVGIGIGIGSSLAELVLSGIFNSLGGRWSDVATHFPIVYTSSLVQQLAAAGLRPGSNLSRVDPGTPGVFESVVVLAIYMVVLVATTLITVSRRDVTS